jgi:hypothetical protein
MPCNHIIGFKLGEFPQHGDTDRLLRIAENIAPDESFTYCPLCGEYLVGTSCLLPGHAELQPHHR